MPRVANPENVKQREAEYKEFLKQIEQEVPANRPESPELQNCINKAKVLLGQKAEILAQLQKMRVLATLLTEADSGSREQVQWVREYLPRKERQSQDSEETNGTGAE